MKKERLEMVIHYFQTQKIAERIEEAHKVARRSVYKEIKKDLLEKQPLKLFKQEAIYEIVIGKEEGIINNAEIDSNQAIDISLICAMTGIDSWDLFKNPGELIVALKKEDKDIAKNFITFLMKGKNFSSFDEKVVL